MAIDIQVETIVTPKASSATIASSSTGLSVQAGDILYFYAAYDNLTTTTPSISSITRVDGSHLNPTWGQVYNVGSPQSASGGGLRQQLWKTEVTSAGTVSASATLDSAVTAKVGFLIRVRGADPGTLYYNGGSPSSNLVILLSPGQEIFHFGAAESSTAPSGIAEGSMTKVAGSETTYSASTTGGSAATNAAAFLRVVESDHSGSVTFSATAATDGGHVVIRMAPAAVSADTEKIAVGSSLLGMDKLYIGDTKVNRVYVGSTMVYDDVP